MMDFKGWKKEAEDKNTVTMRHEKGHMMTLALKAMPKIQREQLKRLPLADGGEVKKKNIEEQSGVQFYDNGAAPVKADNSLSELGAVPANYITPAADIPPSPPAEPSAMAGIQNEAANTLSGVGQGAAGIQQQQQASSNVAQAAAPAIQEAMKRNQAIQDTQNQATAVVNSAADRLRLYQDQHPEDQDQYTKMMKPGEKIATAIGLLVGGFGAPFNGGHNAALDFLNNKITQNIQQQKDNFGNQKSVYDAYHQTFQDDAVATSLATANAKERMANEINLAGAKQGTLQAQANANKASSQLMLDSTQARMAAAGALGKKYMTQGAPSFNMMTGQNEPRANPEIMKTSAQQPNQAQQPPSNPDEDDGPILLPDAQDKLDSLRYTPKASDEIDQIKAQYNQAQQADILMNQLHGVHQQMYEDSHAKNWVQRNITGAPGYLRRHDPTSHIPLVGPLISGATIQPITDTQANRDYSANKTRLITDIANALKGTNVSGDTIQKIVDDNSPEGGDTPEMAAQKEHKIRIFLKNSVPRSLIKDWGIARTK